MNMSGFRMRSIVAACMLVVGSVSSVATAQTPLEHNITAQPPVTANAAIADKADAIAQIDQATRVANEMNSNQEASQLLQSAHGVFIMTSYARAGFGLGVRGGEGVLMVKQQGSWSNPAFYDFGGMSGGFQAGAEAGSLVMVLNNEKAVQSFMQKNNWSLNADAGLTVVAWSERIKGNMGAGDIVVWSNARGLMGDMAVGVTDFSFDEEETGAFYGRQIALHEIFTTDIGTLPHVAKLKQSLPGAAAQSTGGNAVQPQGMPGDGTAGETGTSGSVSRSR